MDPQPGSTEERTGSPFPVSGGEAPAACQIMLTEYTALRTEVDRRATVQWNVLALQLTSTGVIASLALSRASQIALLVVIPLSSYMLGSRYILHDFHLKLISRYIRDSLSERLGGYLAWESWKTSQITRDTGPRGQWPCFRVRCDNVTVLWLMMVLRVCRRTAGCQTGSRWGS
jgi:hypothetical protein